MNPVVYVFYVLCYFKITYSCDTFQNAVFGAYNRKNLAFQITINGCITQSSLGSTPATILHGFKLNVPILKRNSVNNVRDLVFLAINSSNIKILENGAFSNIGNLRRVQLNYNRIEEIRNGVFTNLLLWDVRISNSMISYIENFAFSNMTQLSLLDLSHNNLNYWNRNWFTNSDGIETIDFGYNEINTIPGRAFTFSKKLKIINLENNQINTIGIDAFYGLNSLKELILHFNRLKSIEPDIFPNFLKINILYLSGNKLSYLSNQLLTKIELKYLLIGANPLKCPCLDLVRNKAKEKGTILYDNYCYNQSVPICIFATTSKLVCSEVIDNEAIGVFETALLKIKNWMNCPNEKFYTQLRRSNA